MNYYFQKGFAKQLSTLPKTVQKDVAAVFERIKATQTLNHISNCKKLKSSAGNYYRIRMGDYRIGFILEDGPVVRFVIIGHRKEVYRNFP